MFRLDITDPSTYDPRKEEDKVLRDDWKIVVAWWSRILEDKPFVHSAETVLNLAFLIYHEMKNRDMEIDPESEGGKALVELIESGKVVDAQAMYIVPRHAHLIASGKKTLLVKGKPWNIEGEDFVLITKEPDKKDATALGKMKLGKMEEVTLKQFYKLKGEHLITEEEADEWWPDRGTLYTWPISKFIAYTKPRRIKWTPGTQSFVRTVKFLDSPELAVVRPSGNKIGKRIYLSDVLPHFKSFYTSKPGIHLVGGLCNHAEDGTEGDIDILINKEHSEADDMALEFRILRMLPPALWSRVQFLYDREHRGPFTNHIPLYDTLWERRPDKAVINMAATDQLRAAPAAVKKMAATSRKEDRIIPFRFYLPVKPTHGRRAGQIYSPANLRAVLESFKGWPEAVDEGVYTEQKLDGMRAEYHKVGNRVVIWSEDGNDITKKIPEIKNALLEIKHDFVAEGELELFLDGVHQNRADTAGAVNSANIELTPHLRLTIYDVVWWEGQDVHNEEYESRVEFIDQVKYKGKILPVKRYRPSGIPNVIKAVRDVSAIPGSEGAILKKRDFLYELDGKTSNMLKYKNEFSIIAEVLQRNPVKDTKDVFNYDAAVRRADGSLAYAGKTFNTKIKAEPGERIEVVFVDMNLYTDPETELEWVNWWAPRVIGKTKKPTATLRTAKAFVMKSSGQVGMKREPQLDTAFTDKDILLEYPPEGKCMKGIVHYHQRGRSVHLDFRVQLTKDFAVGFTLFIPKGTSRDATSLKDAEKLWEDEIKSVVMKKLETPTINFNGKPKAKEPIEWLEFEGEAKPGQIGATKFEHGWFVIIDKFCVEWGAQKSWFHEYFLKDGKLFDGRIVFRLLENKEQWKKTPEGKFTWMMNRAKFNPYTIGKRAVNIKWMPPDGISALPEIIRKKIPSVLRYWKEKGREARETRDELVKSKLIPTVDESASFKLQRQTFESIGEKPIRRGVSRVEWHLLIKQDDKVRDILLVADPQGPTTASWEKRGKARWDLEGEIKPKTKFNPFPRTRSDVEVVDKGKATVLTDTSDLVKLRLRGKLLDGVFLMEREQKGSALWSWTPTEAAPGDE